MKMKEVIKQGNAIKLYYQNLLGMVMLRPVLVTLGGGAGGASSLFTPLAPVVHLSTRFLLGACFFEVVSWAIWVGYATFLFSAACFSYSFFCLFWACSLALFCVLLPLLLGYFFGHALFFCNLLLV
jgi:hypothetical protein